MDFWHTDRGWEVFNQYSGATYTVMPTGWLARFACNVIDRWRRVTRVRPERAR